ncbi:hypothetical protein DF186_24135, partial [Enterococcus hirae]
AELVFTDVLWPDFNRSELARCVVEYQRRERRFGKAVDKVGPIRSRGDRGNAGGWARRSWNDVSLPLPPTGPVIPAPSRP